MATKSITRNGYRIYKCKKCGRMNSLPLETWSKIPQKWKRWCNKCINEYVDVIRKAQQRNREDYNKAEYDRINALTEEIKDSSNEEIIEDTDSE